MLCGKCYKHVRSLLMPTTFGLMLKRRSWFALMVCNLWGSARLYLSYFVASSCIWQIRSYIWEITWLPIYLMIWILGLKWMDLWGRSIVFLRFGFLDLSLKTRWFRLYCVSLYGCRLLICLVFKTSADCCDLVIIYSMGTSAVSWRTCCSQWCCTWNQTWLCCFWI